MKKRVLSILLATTMMLSLAACGGSSDSGSSITSVDDLDGALIGVQLGTTGDIYCSDDYGDDNVERYNKGFEAVQALLQGKVDAVVIDDQPAQAFVAANEELTILETAYAVEDYAMCFKKGNEDLLEQVNAAIAELKSNGVFDSIVDYYINDDTQETRYEKADITRAGTLTMATNAEFEPYEYYDGDEIVGIDADFAQAIADILGMELVIEDMNFDSIITAVDSGKADFGAAGMTVTDERKTQVDFTDSYYTGRQVVIVKK